MDYPDPDEEFELMHADELEMMNEFDDYDPPTTNVKPKSKRSLDFTDSCKVTSGPSKLTIKDAPGRLDRREVSTRLEQPQAEDPAVDGLYDSPQGCLPLASLAKRSADHLFGDIDDIIQEERESKRAKVEDGRSKEEMQDLLIRSILNQRRQIQEEMKNSSMTSNVRVEEGQKGCMSRSVPEWPFLAVSGEGGSKIYLRLHSKEDFTAQIKDISAKSNNIGLLNVPYEDLLKEAMQEVATKTEKSPTASNIVTANSGPVKEERDLWVERYKPKNYLELLSNESTNRALLHWLKLWDKVVFNRELRHLKRADVTGKIEELDETGRPHQKVALLCGPPGLGKTTLGHMIAQQAGYNMVEMNASDDRSAQAFRTQLEAATQMKSVMGFDPRPNCLILDEIDGAPQASVEVLVKFVTDKGNRKTWKKKGGGGLLKRPVVCICNDIYVPALRPLRQIAFTLHFPPTSTARLGERLMEVCHKEKIVSDLGTMMALAEKSHNDIRSCLSLLALLKTKGGRVSLGEIAKANLGTKDRQQGLFSVWQAVFHIPTKKIGGKAQGAAASLRQRFVSVLRMVQSYGDYDRLAAGVFENYLSFKTHDSTLSPICNGLDWFCFYDLLSHTIQSTQIYALYPYLPHAFVTWHRLYAGIAWPKINYPTSAYEMAQKKLRLSQVLDYAYAGMVPQVHVFQHRQTLLLDVVSYLLELLLPNIRPVNIQLHTPAEKAEVDRVVSIMIEYNLTYTQERTPDGTYVFHLDPNMEELGNFGERDRSRMLGYPGKQMISKEVELEKIRRLTKQRTEPHQKLESVKTCSEKENVAPAVKRGEMKTAEPGAPLPNHLQKLTAKSRKLLDNQARDFFGRIVEKSLTKEQEKAKTDDIVKSDVWFHFKEGYNNAVRKNVYISDLL